MKTSNVRKVCAFILAGFYLAFSVGATLHQHYCMGELVGTSLFSMQDDACGKCGMDKHTEENKGCCKDVSITVKSNDSHTFSQAVYDVSSPIVLFPPIPLVSSGVIYPETSTENLYRAHSPPLLSEPLFLRFGNFRI